MFYFSTNIPLLVRALLEPDVKHVETNAESKVIFPDLGGGKASSAKLNTKAKAVVPAEDGKRHTQGNSHGIYVCTVYQIV